MERTPPTSASRLATRLVAFVLACAFLLDVAARAADGCWSAAFGRGCCCAIAASDAGPRADEDARRGEEPLASCCAARTSHADDVAASTDPDPTTPARVAPERTCGCRLAPLPSAPAQAPVHDPVLEAAGARGDFAAWIALVTADVSAPAIVADVLAPPTGPPRPPDPRAHLSSAAHRASARDVRGLLAFLGVLRR